MGTVVVFGVVMVLGLLDIPIHKSRVQSLHLLFSLFSEFKNSQVLYSLQSVYQLKPFACIQ